MESPALKQFRNKMANPLHWRMVNRTLAQSSKADLQDSEGASKIIATLAAALDIQLTVTEQQQAAQWLARKQIDPKSKRDRLRLWMSVKKN